MADKLKDTYFTTSSLRKMAESIQRHHPTFEEELFLAKLQSDDWSDLEILAKLRRTSLVLHDHLKLQYPEAIKVLAQAIPDFEGFECLVPPDYVQNFGMHDWKVSLEALKHFTKYGTSEFAIRPFLNRDLAKTMAFIVECAGDEHEKVRRFASEGCRPRLPWSTAIPALKKDPTPILPILTMLRNDISEDVRRSVANNLNDISKDNPEVAFELAEGWMGETENTDKLVKHAMRTLLKAGDQRALLLFGFGEVKNVHVTQLTISSPKIKIGEDVTFTVEFSVDSESHQKLRLEYLIDFAKANGKRSQKVFQLREGIFEPGNHSFTRKLSFKNLTTRKHYPGKHLIVIHINGVEKAKLEFELEE
ncbi:DNA alkylation repair protein [bacterium]|nr:DNA alkylation repair protein [bacterium]